MKTLICVVATSLIISCQGSSDSNVSGHYENMDKSEAESIAQSQPKVISEHSETESIIISLKLLANDSMAKAEYGLALLETGVKLIIITDKNFNGGLDNPNLSQFAQLAKPFEGSIQFVSSLGNDAPTVWARDWGPIMANNSKEEKIALDFNYYPNRPFGDIVPSIFDESEDSVDRLSVPVYNEGGNFMSNNRFECLMTSRVSDANADNSDRFITDEFGIPIAYATPRDEGGRVVTGVLGQDLDGELMIRQDDEFLADSQIVDFYQRYAGCSKVHIFPRMPHEGTGHIDMWAKFLDDDTVLVNEIRENQLSLIDNDETLKVAKDIQAYLNARIVDIKNLGYKVTTVPMPIPQVYSTEYQGQTYTDYIMRSYTNSLFVINNGEKHALIPRYTVPAEGTGVVEYVDAALIAQYELEVLDAYLKYGYQNRYIDADDLIALAGAVHCTTMQIPK